MLRIGRLFDVCLRGQLHRVLWRCIGVPHSMQRSRVLWEHSSRLMCGLQRHDECLESVSS